MKSNTFRLLNIILIESSFKRKPIIEFDKELKNNINIDIQNSIEGSNLYVTVTLKFDTALHDKKFIVSKIKMLGIFEFGDNPKLSIEDFGHINAPAIIFPYIREHLSNVSMKAGIQPILLPPINFVQLAKKKSKK
ncbi:MAG: protein-export chaperone SecB [Bacteroidales bacterium]|nr:protein-export chaperone SecB [Bacteroidales bacterium]